MGAWALLALALAGLGLRLWRALHAHWYWDEGYMAEMAQDLGALQRPHIGALWSNGVMPLTASWLAPLSAAPFTWVLPDALLAVRVWAALLGAVAIVFAGLAGKRWGGWSLGLTAAALLALGPLPVALGGLGLYHALGAALGVAALWAALPAPPGERETAPGLAWALAGWAVAACYWMWWLPVALVLVPAGRRPLAWPWRLALGWGPLLVVVAAAFALGGRDSLAMAWAMAHYTRRGLSWADLGHSVVLFPALWLGLAGVVRLDRRRAWMGVAVFLGWADLLRQRGSLYGSPYALLPLLPWACLGLAAWAQRLGRLFPRGAWLGAALGLAALWPRPLFWIDRLSVPPPMARNLQAYLRAQHCGQDTVVGMGCVDWRLRAVCRPVELSQAAAARGWSGGLLPAGLTPAAFALDARLQDARYLVISEQDFTNLFLTPHLALEALVAEFQGWPLVFANPAFRVYANPRRGARRDPAVRILFDPALYRQAAVDAQALGHPEWAAFALKRAAAATGPRRVNP